MTHIISDPTMRSHIWICLLVEEQEFYHNNSLFSITSPAPHLIQWISSLFSFAPSYSWASISFSLYYMNILVNFITLSSKCLQNLNFQLHQNCLLVQISLLLGIIKLLFIPNAHVVLFSSSWKQEGVCLT